MRRAVSSSAFGVGARVAVGADGARDALLQRVDPRRQVRREAEHDVGGRLGVTRRTMVSLVRDAEEPRDVAQLVGVLVGVGLANQHERVEVGPLRESLAAHRLMEKAEVEADVVADDIGVTGELAETAHRLG